MDKDTIKIKLENVKLHNRIDQIKEKNNRTKEEVFNLISRYQNNIQIYKKEIEEIKKENEMLKYELKSLNTKYDKVPKIIKKFLDKGDKI